MFPYGEFPYREIEEKIGYVFRDKELLKKAFTHSTYVNQHGGESNERLEFLGDAVLDFAVAEKLYEDKRKLSEGEMTNFRADKVSKEPLERVVKRMGISDYLLMEGSRKWNIGSKTISSLFETVTAAIYLDGGFERAKEFIFRFLDAQTLISEEKNVNYKGKLKEWLENRGEALPEYTDVEKSGLDNAPTFIVSVSAMNREARGEGGTKKQAEQAAAKNLLKQLGGLSR